MATVVSFSTETAILEEGGKMPRGRRMKAVKPPTKFDRNEKLRQQIIRLTDDLLAEGYGALLKPPGPLQPIAQAIEDRRTDGMIAHVEEPLGAYIQRVSVVENFSQRPPFDHVIDSIYRRLTRDFISGAAMPESKVAALSRSNDRRANSLEEPDISYSIIDGLQRLYCYCIALLAVMRGHKLVRDGAIPEDAWEYFRESIDEGADPRALTEKMLQRMVRYEVFYNIDLAGLLHYMVTFNTAQRRMSLPVQLEIMRKPLIEELQRAAIPLSNDMEMTPGMKKQKDRFSSADLVLATEAFITNNAQVTASKEAERFLEDEKYLENVGEVDDVVTTLRRITTQIHPLIMQVYADDPNRRFILSAGGTFLLGLAAACGYIRNRINMKALDAALDKLVEELQRPKEDPLKLADYMKALSMITASRGKAMRRLVYDTFLRFFTGATTELEWRDTVSQITGIV